MAGMWNEVKSIYFRVVIIFLKTFFQWNFEFLLFFMRTTYFWAITMSQNGENCWEITHFTLSGQLKMSGIFVRRDLFIAQPFPTAQLARECFCGTFAIIFCRSRHMVAHQRSDFAARGLGGVRKRATVQVR